MKSMVLFFVMVVVTLVAVVAGIGGLGVLYQKHQIRVEQEREAAFQKEFGIPYPGTLAERKVAVATVVVQVAKLYQESLDSWNMSHVAEEKLVATEVPPTKPVSVSEQIEIFDRQDKARKEAREAEVLQKSNYDRLAKACSLLYHHSDDKWVDSYPEFQIPDLKECHVYQGNVDEIEDQGGNVF
jgi:hypothetical protein